MPPECQISVSAILLDPTFSQISETRRRALMDMMGGVLEVKREDILKMVRFLDIPMEGGMGST